MMLAHTTESIVQLRLPASIDPTSILHIVVFIRDRFDCIHEFQLPSVTVLRDISTTEKFIDILQKPYNNSDNDIILQLLVSGDMNTVGQIVTSISQVFNEMNNQTIKNAALSKYFFGELVQIIVFCL
jgi:hypothetical protein